MKYWKRGSRHVVFKTRTEHKCEACYGVIPIGSTASYRNAFTGKRVYKHAPCPQGAIDRMVAKNRKACSIANMNRSLE